MERLLKDVVVVSRKWNESEINTRVNISNEAIYISVPINEFMEGLIHEMGSVTWVFSDFEFQKRMKEAKDRVIKSMKQESKKGV